jgi:hypothetical protein
MKYVKVISIIICCLFASTVVKSQTKTETTGTITLSINSLPSFDLRSGGNPQVTPSSGISASSQTPDTPLNTTITITNAAPTTATGGGFTANVPIRLRSNAPYKLMASRSGNDSSSMANFDATDIKMGVTFSARNNNAVISGSDTPTTGFEGTTATNTVGTLTHTPLQIANGSRISNRGNTISSDNFITANLNFRIPRQFYTPGLTYSDTITVSIVSIQVQP